MSGYPLSLTAGDGNFTTFRNLSVADRELAFISWEYGFKDTVKNMNMGGIEILVGDDVHPRIARVCRSHWSYYETPKGRSVLLQPEDTIAILQILFKEVDVNGVYVIPNICYYLAVPLMECRAYVFSRFVQIEGNWSSKARGTRRMHPHGSYDGTLSPICWYGENEVLRAIFNLRFEDAIVILTQHAITASGNHFVHGSRICDVRGCSRPVEKQDHNRCSEHGVVCASCGKRMYDLEYMQRNKTANCRECNSRLECPGCWTMMPRMSMVRQSFVVLDQVYDDWGNRTGTYRRFTTRNTLVCRKCLPRLRCSGCREYIEPSSRRASQFVKLRNRITRRSISRCALCAQELEKEIIHEQEQTSQAKAGEPRYEVLERFYPTIRR